MRKSDLDKIREKRAQANFKQVELDINGLYELMLPKRYDPITGKMVSSGYNPSQKAFLSSPAPNKAFKGTVGSGKSFTVCADGWIHLLFCPGYQLLVGRWDYNKLLDTTMNVMEKILYRLPKGILIDRDKDPPQRWWINPVVPSGSDLPPEPSQVTFMGLKDNLGSYEFHGAIIDEADDIPSQAKAGEVASRCRLPGASPVLDIPFNFMNLAFNPPSKTHWLYEACTGLDAKSRPTGKLPAYTLFEPRPYENAANLTEGYYEKLAAAFTSDQVERLIRNEWGSTFEGQPVFREFKLHLHGKQGLMKRYDPRSHLFRFWDFGYNEPRCLWAQTDHWGRLLIFMEHVKQFIEARPFADQVKALTAQHFPGATTVDFGDPAVRQKKDTGQTLAKLAEAGIHIRFRITPIDVGISAIRKRLELMVEAEPAVQIDKDNCPVLIDAMKGGYRMDDRGEKPYKDGFYDNSADCLRYGVVNVFGVLGSIPYTDTSSIPTSLMRKA